jgi:hypothetical protein
LNYCKSRLKNTKTFQYAFPCWFLFVAKSSSNHGAHELFVQINSKKGRCCQQTKNTLGSLIHSLWNLNQCLSPITIPFMKREIFNTLISLLPPNCPKNTCQIHNDWSTIASRMMFLWHIAQFEIQWQCKGHYRFKVYNDFMKHVLSHVMWSSRAKLQI